MSSGLGGKKNERSRRGDQPTGASTDQVLAVGQKGVGSSSQSWASSAGVHPQGSYHPSRVERSRTTHTSYTELDREDPKGHVDAWDRNQNSDWL